MPNADDIRDAPRAAWAGLSAGWEKRDAVIRGELTPWAQRRARAEGITNVETRVCSADRLPFDDAAFDAIAQVSAFEEDDEVRVPGVARCILGTKATSMPD